MIQTITLIALWLASGLMGSVLMLAVAGGIDALTNTRDEPIDELKWTVAALGPIALLIGVADLLGWAMPRLMRSVFKR